MRIMPEDYIREFYKDLPEEFKSYGFDNIRDVCCAPFIFLRKSIQSNYLPTIRFKYFGVFRPFEKKALFELKKAETRFAKGYISEKEYYRIKNMVEGFIERRKNGEV